MFFKKIFKILYENIKNNLYEYTLYMHVINNKV
jgi:hypothetical protein